MTPNKVAWKIAVWEACLNAFNSNGEITFVMLVKYHLTTILQNSRIRPRTPEMKLLNTLRALEKPGFLKYCSGQTWVVNPLPFEK